MGHDRQRKFEPLNFHLNFFLAMTIWIFTDTPNVYGVFW